MSDTEQNFALLQQIRWRGLHTETLAGTWSRQGDSAVASFGHIEDANAFAYKYLGFGNCFKTGGETHVKIDRHIPPHGSIAATVHIPLDILRETAVQKILDKEIMLLGPVRHDPLHEAPPSDLALAS